MTAKPVTRRQLMAALKRQDENEVSEILSVLYHELGEERFHDILLDLWQHQAEALTQFARRSERKPPALWDGALLQIQSLIKTNVLSEAIHKATVKSGRESGKQKQTAWVLQSTGYKQSNLPEFELDQAESDAKPWYELDALARLDRVDMCALAELSELSHGEGLDESTVKHVRVVVKRWRAIADHLETLDQKK